MGEIAAGVVLGALLAALLWLATTDPSFFLNH